MSSGLPSSPGQQSHCHPPQSRTLQVLGKPFPRTLSVIFGGSASRLGFIDGLSLSQTAHSGEVTAGIHVMKEPGCLSLCAVRCEPWTVSPR